MQPLETNDVKDVLNARIKKDGILLTDQRDGLC